MKKLLLLFVFVMSFSVIAKAEVLAEGYLGEDVTCVLTDDGILHVSGEGEIYDDFGYAKTPWDHIIESVNEIIIEEGITRIGMSIFDDCVNLTSVSLPESITSIGLCAFENCTNLVNINLPDGITKIGYHAFENTGYYNNSSNWDDSVLYIGNHLIKAKSSISGEYSVRPGTKSIAEYAFFDCDKLTMIDLPNSIEGIGRFAFENTGLYNDVSNWKDNLLYIGNYLIGVSTSISGHVKVKQGTKFIGDNMFMDCADLTGISIPESVSFIGELAFCRCEKLTDVIMTDNVSLIGNEAFSSCSKLKNINISKNVTNIGKGAFDGCSSLKSVTIPNTVVKIESSTFADCFSLKNITIPSSVEIIDAYAFFACKSLEKITIPAGVEYIDLEAFESCTSLKEILLPNSLKRMDVNFDYCDKLSLVYYCGTEEEWNNILIGGRSKEKLLNTKIIFLEDVKATPTNAKIIVNGTEIAFTAYNIAGYNYFKLRDLAQAMNSSEKSFNVGWDDAKKIITILSDCKYEPIGKELLVDENAMRIKPVVTNAKVLVNGESIPFVAFNIKDYNYFKLRDIGKVLDFGVGWDDATRTITIDTSKSYTE